MTYRWLSQPTPERVSMLVLETAWSLYRAARREHAQDGWFDDRLWTECMRAARDLVSRAELPTRD